MREPRRMLPRGTRRAVLCVLYEFAARTAQERGTETAEAKGQLRTINALIRSIIRSTNVTRNARPANLQVRGNRAAR
jgi:hypothetical protein